MKQFRNPVQKFVAVRAVAVLVVEERTALVTGREHSFPVAGAEVEGQAERLSWPAEMAFAVPEGPERGALCRILDSGRFFLRHRLPLALPRCSMDSEIQLSFCRMPHVHEFASLTPQHTIS